MSNLPYLTGVFRWVLQTTWQAAVLAGLILLAQCLLRKRLSAGWRYGLWLLLVARLLMPATPQSALSIFNLVRSKPSKPFETRRYFSPGPKSPYVAVNSFNGSPSPSISTTPVELPPLLPPPGVTIIPRRTLDWFGVAFCSWLAGVCFFGARLVWTNGRFRSRIGGHQPISDEAVTRLFEECRAALKITQPVLLIETEEVESPAVYGLWRKWLLLPDGIFERFSMEELRCIVLHELAHIKRGDLGVNWVVSVLQAAHWFNPVLWLAFARMRADRELATDAMALAHVAASENVAYGETILKVVENLVRGPAQPGLVGIAESKAGLKSRLRAIAQFGAARSWKWVAAVVAVAIGGTGLTDARQPVAATTPTTDWSRETKGPDGRNVRIEEQHFDAARVRYKWLPGLPPSDPRAVREVGVRPEFRGEPLLSAQFSLQFFWPAYPAIGGLRVAAADEQGNEFDSGIIDMVQSANSDNREYWVGEVPVFPRRGKEVRLKVLSGEKLIAEFSIPNPAPAPHPTWTAQTLPARQRDGNLEVTLADFRTIQPDHPNKQNARTECVFNIREQNHETVAWHPVVLEVSDATGNHWRVKSHSATEENGGVRFGFAGALWPGESAWKLRAEFARASGFPENERLEITKIRIPEAPTAVYEPHTHYAVNGADVELAGVIGTFVDKEFLIKEHKQLMNAKLMPGCVTVALAGEIVSRHRRLAFVSAVDDQGRSLDLTGFKQPITGKEVPYSFVLKVPASAREINMVVGVSESRFVEFVAKPEQVFHDLSPLR
jgi:beta-lactamase regulating signal transducer with metallopeptidase domain